MKLLNYMTAFWAHRTPIAEVVLGAAVFGRSIGAMWPGFNPDDQTYHVVAGIAPHWVWAWTGLIASVVLAVAAGRDLILPGPLSITRVFRLIAAYVTTFLSLCLSIGFALAPTANTAAVGLHAGIAIALLYCTARIAAER